MHDADRFAAAREARLLVHEATRRTDPVWRELTANLNALEAAAGRTVEPDRRRITTWSWKRLRGRAEEALAIDRASFPDHLRRLAALHARVRKAGDLLMLEILPQLTTGGAWPENGAPHRAALEALGLEDEIETIERELSGAWPEPEDPEGLAVLLQRLGMTVGAEDRIQTLALMTVAVEGMERTLSRMRLLARRTVEERWPLDDAIRLVRNSEDLDLYFGRSLDDAEPVPQEFRARLARLGRIVERRDVDWSIGTVEELRAHLAPFDTRGELVGRRFQRDILATWSELLLVDLEYLGERAAQLRRRLVILKDRTLAARQVVAFVEGPLKRVRFATRHATEDDGIFATVRHQIDSARQGTRSSVEIPATAGDGVRQMEFASVRVAAAVRAVAAADAALRLDGELRVRESLARFEEENAEHRRSIEQSRVASLGWKRLLDDGAQGLESYWAGGLKGEDFTKLILLAGDMISSTYGALR